MVQAALATTRVPIAMRFQMSAVRFVHCWDFVAVTSKGPRTATAWPGPLSTTCFFPTLVPLADTMASFATDTGGFFARPPGGIVFGHYGDRISRRSMLN
jgi:hypothetical protein